MFFDGGLGDAFEGLAGVGGPGIGLRLLLTLLVVVGALVLRRVVARAVRRRFGTAGRGGGGGPSEAGRDDRHSAYWMRKVTTYAVWGVAVLLVVLIWAEFGRRLGSVVGAFSAGVAFALQNVLGSFAAWLGILGGKVFRVGDRVMMGGVKGDVIDLSPLRTTVMEIGSPGAPEDSDVWVRARQYTGRIVTVSNKAFFDEPIYNYSKDFDYVWEEIAVPVSYASDWERGRDILLGAVEEATRGFRVESAESLNEMSRRYLVAKDEVEPRVFVRLTDNWVELSARFVLPTRSARQIKSEISENVLRAEFEECKLAGASLEEADLTAFVVSGGDLSYANLFEKRDLKGQDLGGVRLVEAELAGCDLSGTDLGGADLSRANLSRAKLKGADLRGANLEGVILSALDLRGAMLDVEGAVLLARCLGAEVDLGA